jgi:hypothetical protein
MTHSKKLKKAIRARAARTGESYTTARTHVLASREKPKPAPAPKPPKRSVISDASAVKATGKGFDHWFAVLDAFGAPAKGHTASAAHLNEDHGVRGWHSQMITVAYERARGLRSVNQSCNGDFQVGVSKAMAGTVEAIVAAMRERRWLEGADPELARAYPEAAAWSLTKSGVAKLRFKWGAGTVEVRITPKKGGATVVADNMKLADAAQVERRRAQWRGALDSLRNLVAK